MTAAKKHDTRMSHTLRIPPPTTALHLYRHLLRESSYLPPFARTYVDSRIKYRFRLKHLNRTQQAIRALRMLRAANAGDIERMRKVLLHCFGRMGQRRRELLAQFVLKPAIIPSDSEEVAKYAEVAATAAQSPNTRDWDWLDRWDVDKIRTFALSQVSAGLDRSPRPDIRWQHLKMSKYTPDKNIWGRTPSLKLTRSRLRKAWKLIIHRILPPLPKEEWEHLRHLATSENKWVDPKQRRPVAQSLLGECKDIQHWKWRDYTIWPVAAVDRQAAKKYKLLSGATDNNTPTGDPQGINCHTYTPSLWRRLLRHIWSCSAYMERKPDGSGWNIVWGGSRQSPGFVDAPAKEFFEIISDKDERLINLKSNRQQQTAAGG